MLIHLDFSPMAIYTYIYIYIFGCHYTSAFRPSNQGASQVGGLCCAMNYHTSSLKERSDNLHRGILQIFNLVTLGWTIIGVHRCLWITWSKQALFLTGRRTLKNMLSLCFHLIGLRFGWFCFYSTEARNPATSRPWRAVVFGNLRILRGGSGGVNGSAEHLSAWT